MTNKLINIKTMFGIVGVGAILASGALLSVASPASALSCEQMESRLNFAIYRADALHTLGDHYAAIGQGWIAESYFYQERNQWLNIMTLQVC